jgi:valyl-tRNA synthetase
MTIVLTLTPSKAYGLIGKVTTHLRPWTPNTAPITAWGIKRGRALAISQLSNTDAVSHDVSMDAYDEQNKALGIVGKYDPSTFESKIYSWWEKAGCFQPDAKYTVKKSDKQPYVIPMPPPNVTGRLHMGHAIFVALQDVLARFHRMRGRPVLWLPGTDHAGIATQLQVEKILLSQGKEWKCTRNSSLDPFDSPSNPFTFLLLYAMSCKGTNREAVGREKFLQRVWEYKEEQGGHITRQLRSLGASADWSRERFTMDPDLCDAVTEAFVRFHEKGLVYKGEYMVNWAPLLKTAVSDLEVEYSEEEGKLYFFKYMLDDVDPSSPDQFIPVSTTRPETILGDTALCVHPEDERYKHLIGKRVRVPMSGDGSTARTIPVIADEYVDREFGTGALKITPGHDPNDYTLGKKHNLPIINIMNKDGTMNEKAGRYVNLDRFAAREKIWADMQEHGLVIKVSR